MTGSTAHPRPFLLAVTGGSGSGKTTLARTLADLLLPIEALIIHEDDYYRDHGSRPGFDPLIFNFDEPAARDHDLLLSHLLALRRHEAVSAPRYDFTTHCRLPGAVEIAPKPVIIAEGIHLLASPELRAVFDLTVYLDVPDSVRLRRRLQRDVTERGRDAASVLRQFESAVLPMHRRHTEPARQHAHLVFAEDDNNAPFQESLGSAAALVANRITAALAGQ